MPQIELSAGPIDYQDTGGNGPVLVFGHGLPMNEKQWRKVVPLLPGYRCVLPTLPMGAHRRPMRPDADLSQTGMALLLGEFIDRLDLDDVTLVLNDWGGGQFLISEGRAQRIGRLVLVTCEAFDNFPPGPAKAMAPLCRTSAGAWLALQAMRLSNRTNGGYGAMSRRGIPKELMDEWVAPAVRDKAVRRDFGKFATGAPDRKTLLSYSERLRDFDRPVLVVWAAEDKLMPREHGPRLAELYPQGRLVEMADSSTLVPEDQPERLVEVMTEFLAETGVQPV